MSIILNKSTILTLRSTNNAKRLSSLKRRVEPAPILNAVQILSYLSFCVIFLFTVSGSVISFLDFFNQPELNDIKSSTLAEDLQVKNQDLENQIKMLREELEKEKNSKHILKQFSDFLYELKIPWGKVTIVITVTIILLYFPSFSSSLPFLQQLDVQQVISELFLNRNSSVLIKLAEIESQNTQNSRNLTILINTIINMLRDEGF